MRTIELTYPHTLLRAKLPKTICAIGFFDGIHKGHQKVISAAVKEAKNKKMQSAVMSFHPHPSVVLKKEVEPVKYITTIEEKKKILQQLNVDLFYIINFNKELSLLSPQEFIEHFIKNIHINHLIAGFDYTFGHKGQGNMENISLYAQNDFTFESIQKVEYEDEKISSTKIRSLLKAGKIEKVNTLLGRVYSLSGIVMEGDKRGRTIGYPTANLKIDPEVLTPKIGVYAVKVTYNSNKYKGMANIGVNPTFTSDIKEPVLEVNILDFQGNVYGEELNIEFHSFIRPEKKFNGVRELVKQIENDEVKIRNNFAKTKNI